MTVGRDIGHLTPIYHRSMALRVPSLDRSARAGLLLLVMSIALLAGLGASGVPAMAQSGLPDVASYPPPAWVAPGTRITTYSAAASVAQSSYQLVDDSGRSMAGPGDG